MEHKKDKKRTTIISPILWVITTIMWAITVCVNIIDGDIPPFWLALRCATAIMSGAAAVANYIRYKRENNDKSK